MRIVQEDSKLGITKVVWQFSQEPDPFTVSEPETSKGEADAAVEPVPELSEAVTSEPDVEEIPTIPGDGLAGEAPAQPDHLTDMRQMIQFLQQVIETQNHQLKTKDELIRNFQVLLKSEQDQVLRLESRVTDRPSEADGTHPETTWFQSLKKKLRKQLR